jgi:hypothetical protein
MTEEPKLKTKLEFQFNTEGMEIPEMDFLVDDPIEQTKPDIRVLERKRPKIKNTKKLF